MIGPAAVSADGERRAFGKLDIDGRESSVDEDRCADDVGIPGRPEGDGIAFTFACAIDPLALGPVVVHSS